MKHLRLALALVVALVLVGTVVAQAVENSVIYMPLTQSAQFTSRVTYIIATQAPVVLAEASGVTCHPLRASLAARVAANPAAFAPVFAVHLVTNVNITTGGALTGTGATLDTPANDAALLAAVASLWPTVAGCITNP